MANTTDNVASMEQRNALVKEAKELVSGVSEVSERREIIDTFIADKREEGFLMNIEDFGGLIEGPKQVGRPKGKSYDFDDLCPSVKIKVPSVGAELYVPTTKEALCMRNYFLTESVRSMISSCVMYYLKRLKQSNGSVIPETKELTTLVYLVQQTNANAKKEWDDLLKIVNKVDGKDVDAEELIQDFEDFVRQHLPSQKKKSKEKPDDSAINKAKDITKYVKKHESDAGESE